MPWDERVGQVEIERSVYAADFARLGEQLETLLAAGVRAFHFDVGDGRFVDPITIGPIVLKSIAPIVDGAGALLDCHLMVVEPEKHFEQVGAAGGHSARIVRDVHDAGADLLVAGSSIFWQDDPAAAYLALRERLEATTSRL